MLSLLRSLAPAAAVTSVHFFPALVVLNRCPFVVSTQHAFVLEQSAESTARFFLPAGGRSMAFHEEPLAEYRSDLVPKATTPLLTTSAWVSRAVATGLPETDEKLPPPLVERRTPLGPISSTVLLLSADTSLGARPPPVFLRAQVEPPLVVPHSVPPESSTKPLLASANDALSTALELGIVLDVHVTPPFWLVTIAPEVAPCEGEVGVRGPQARQLLAEARADLGPGVAAVGRGEHRPVGRSGHRLSGARRTPPR